MTAATISQLEDAPARAASEPVAPIQALKGRLDASLSGKRKLLTIHAEKGDGGDHAVFISLNEFPYQVPRGKPFNVPSELVEILDNAVVSSFEREERTGEIVTRRTPRFAYSVSDVPAEAKPAAAAAKK